MVVIPGSTKVLKCERTWPASLPDSRILSISFFDLPIIISTSVSYDCCDLAINLFGVTSSFYGSQQTRPSIIINQGTRLFVEGGESSSHCLRIVVRSMS